LTRNALAEIEHEKDYSPEETLVFLREPLNFMSVSAGIKRELARLGVSGTDEHLLLQAFKDVLKSAGFSHSHLRHAEGWLHRNILPNPKFRYPVRLCFAFQLSEQAALDFLWKVCRVNGFNFRRACDVVYAYCLDNKRSYADAQALIKSYDTATANQDARPNDATKRTQTLRAVFGSLSGLGDDVFLKLLCDNKHNFIGYSLTASEEVKRLSDSLHNFIRADIDGYNRYAKYAGLAGYDHGVSLYPEIIYAFDRINSAARTADTSKTTFANMMSGFPQHRYLSQMLSRAEAATDTEHDKARKMFILLFFAEYALKRSRYLEKRPNKPRAFYPAFYLALNDALDKCGYAALYPANPYDWLILNCVRSLDVSNQLENINPVELFNETLILLAEKRSTDGDEQDG